MTGGEARQALIVRLLEKAEMALAAARRECDAGDLPLAMNRVYYACFYSASAVFVLKGREYAKHAGLRSAVHQHLVKTGLVEPELGRFYDDAFDDRQEADYGAMADFELDHVKGRIGLAERFVNEMKRLLDQNRPETRENSN